MSFPSPRIGIGTTNPETPWAPAEMPRRTQAAEDSGPVPVRGKIEINEERLRLAEAAGQIGTWEWDPERNARFLSPELHRIFGLADSDPEAERKWSARVWPEDWSKVQQLMKEGSETGKVEFEYRYQHPEDGLRWLYCRGCRFHNEPRMFGIVQDISDRKVAEEAAQRLAAIVASSDDAIVSKDLTGIVTSWNPGAERIFGYTREEMVGRSIVTLIPPELRDDEIRILATIARGERIEHFETTRVKKNGDLIDVSLTVSPVKDEAGRIVGAAKIARDITQRKRTEHALLVTERLAVVGRLAATVAHEINNPLEAVTNLIYLAKTASPPGEVQGFLTAAEEQMATVSHLTRQTLGFYRETSGARLIRPGEILTDLLSVFASRARNKGIQLKHKVRTDAAINAVPGEVRQVLANLISNSIDAMQKPGRIEIRVSAVCEDRSRSPRGVRITVADTGAGIPATARKHIFEPFFTTKRDVGTGLGLWVCKSIVDNHRGSIRLRSITTPGKSGTAVSVFFPIDSSASQPVPAEWRTKPEAALRKAS